MWIESDADKSTQTFEPKIFTRFTFRTVKRSLREARDEEIGEAGQKVEGSFLISPGYKSAQPPRKRSAVGEGTSGRNGTVRVWKEAVFAGRVECETNQMDGWPGRDAGMLRCMLKERSVWIGVGMFRVLCGFENLCIFIVQS